MDFEFDGRVETITYTPRVITMSAEHPFLSQCQLKPLSDKVESKEDSER